MSQPLPEFRIAIQVLESLRDTLGGDFAHLEDSERRYVTLDHRDQLSMPAPDLTARSMVGNHLRRSSGCMFKAHQAPALAHCRVDSYVAGVVQQVQLAVANRDRSQRAHEDAVLDSMLSDEFCNPFFVRIAPDGVMQAQPDMRGFVRG